MLLYNAIMEKPRLNYAVGVSKLDTQIMYPLHLYLLKAGSVYQDCIQLAQRFSWRSGFLNVVK